MFLSRYLWPDCHLSGLNLTLARPKFEAYLATMCLLYGANASDTLRQLQITPDIMAQLEPEPSSA